MDTTILDEAFFQARLKINRAYRHLEEANGLFQAYIESDFCKLVEEPNIETGGQSFRAEALPISADLVLAIGDTFHNLSVALDYVMTGMMRAASASSSRVGFPTNETRKALRDAFMPPKTGKKSPPSRRIAEHFPAFVMLLLQKIKPYRGGDLLLWEVRKADNIDKHNLIIPSVTISELRGISLVDEKNDNRIDNMTAIVGAGGRINLIRYAIASGELKVTNKGKATACITFADDMEIFAGEPVFPTLLRCISSVDEAVELIRLYGTRLRERI